MLLQLLCFSFLSLHIVSGFLSHYKYASEQIESDHNNYFITYGSHCPPFPFLRCADTMTICPKEVDENLYLCYEDGRLEKLRIIVHGRYAYCPYLWDESLIEGLTKIQGVCREKCNLCFCYYDTRHIADVPERDLDPERKGKDEETEQEEENGIVTKGDNENDITLEPALTPETTTPGDVEESDKPEQKMRYFDEPKRDEEKEKLIGSQSVNFSIGLLKSLRDEYPHENIFVSPAAIMAILKLLHDGAGGETKEEIENVLGEPYDIQEFRMQSRQTNTFQVETALMNGNEEIRLNKYRELRKRNVHVENIEFDEPYYASYKINDWLNRDEETFTPEDLEGTNMVILNDMSFSGVFGKPFTSGKDDTMGFTSFEGDVLNAVALHGDKDGMYYIASSASLLATAVEIPYEDSSLVMRLILPDDNVNITEVEDKLSVETMDEIDESLEEKQVHLALPKVKLNFEKNMKTALMKMGFENTFNNTNLTELFRPTERPYYYYYEDDSKDEEESVKFGIFYHSADYMISENTMEMEDENMESEMTDSDLENKESDSESEKKVSLAVDRPFLVFIQDKESKQVLFVGRIGE